MWVEVISGILILCDQLCLCTRMNQESSEFKKVVIDPELVPGSQGIKQNVP